MSEVLAQLEKKGGGESKEPVFGALVFAGSGQYNGCYGLENGEIVAKQSGTMSNDYTIDFAYTSSVHKLAVYSINGGTYVWRKQVGSSVSSGTAVVGAGQFICGQTTGTSNFSCTFYKVSD